jgi:hypothetical protein
MDTQMDTRLPKKGNERSGKERLYGQIHSGQTATPEQGTRAIYYCRIRTDEGRCVSWRSTGETEKSKAFQWALRRLKTATS